MTRVLRGRKGAFVIQMDLGSAVKCAEDGINQPQSRNIPWETLPTGLMEAVQRAEGTTSKRPDGLLYKPQKGNYWIIEVKICSDADPQGQQSKADYLYQHENLMEKIKVIDPTAKVYMVLSLIHGSSRHTILEHIHVPCSTWCYTSGPEKLLIRYPRCCNQIATQHTYN
jgi:hypothetical protein